MPAMSSRSKASTDPTPAEEAAILAAHIANQIVDFPVGSKNLLSGKVVTGHDSQGNTTYAEDNIISNVNTDENAGDNSDDSIRLPATTSSSPLDGEEQNSVLPKSVEYFLELAQQARLGVLKDEEYQRALEIL
jgi:hypothetical protein